MDLSYLNPGTVVANFEFAGGKARYPNKHGYHAGLFYEFGERIMGGGYTRIWMIDQWRGKTVKKRDKLARSPEEMRKGFLPCDNANDFYVVVVP